MPPANPTSQESDSGFARHAWWVVLIVAICLYWFATERRIDRVEAMTHSPTWSVDAPQFDPASTTGYERGQRALIVPGHHNPSFWWITEAQQAAAEGRLRIRHISYDALPDGRDIERTSPYRWWLIALGWVRSTVFGESLGLAIERGTLVADPLLLVMMIAAGAIYIARFRGSLASTVFVIGGVSLFPLAANFQPGAPDPHSLAWVLALGSILPFVVAPRVSGKGRAVHLAVAGVLGGIGFWNDATTQAPVLIAILVGGVCLEFVRSRGSRDQTVGALEWRVWATAGGVTALLASLFEFAPHHLSLSLDAVNPVHAVAWLGMGEVLRGTGIWCSEGKSGLNKATVLLFAAGCIAATSWPVVAFATGSGTLLAPDFYASELANHPRGSIAPSFGIWLGRGKDDGAIFATLLPCALLLVVVARIWLGKLEKEQRALEVFVGVAAAVAALLACVQLRWWNLADALLLAVIASLFPRASTRSVRAWGEALVIFAISLPGLIIGFPAAHGDGRNAAVTSLENQALIERDYSYWLVQHRGAEPIVLFSTPIFSGAAAFYGGFGVVCSSDDRNKNGTLTAVRIAGATTEQEVAVLLRSKGVTNLALPLWDPVLDQLVRIAMNLPAGQPLPEKAFAVSLRLWDMPVWMRPMDYLIPNEERFHGFDLRSFSVGAAEDPDLVLSRLADFFLDRGQMQEAQALRESLKVYPRSPVALGAVGRISLVLRDRQAVEETLADLEPMLSRRSARDLPVDRRISLALLFFQTNRRDLARTQLETAMSNLDDLKLRSLMPGGVINLVELSGALGVPLPSQPIEKLALELIPPSVRSGMKSN